VPGIRRSAPGGSERSHVWIVGPPHSGHGGLHGEGEVDDPVQAKARQWSSWEERNERRWDALGLGGNQPEPAAAWERPGKRPCIHCHDGPAAYANGACRTCYRWILRNRDRYPADQLIGELHQRVRLRRP
jgi:hypothetical protein